MIRGVKMGEYLDKLIATLITALVAIIGWLFRKVLISSETIEVLRREVNATREQLNEIKANLVEFRKEARADTKELREEIREENKVLREEIRSISK